jgi:hypothetical protein
MITARMPPSTKVPSFFKDHPLYDTFKYCQKGAFYENKDYDNFVKVIYIASHHHQKNIIFWIKLHY